MLMQNFGGTNKDYYGIFRTGLLGYDITEVSAEKNYGTTTVRHPTVLSNVHLGMGTNCNLVRQHPVLNQNVMTSSRTAVIKLSAQPEYSAEYQIHAFGCMFWVTISNIIGWMERNPLRILVICIKVEFDYIYLKT